MCCIEQSVGEHKVPINGFDVLRMCTGIRHNMFPMLCAPCSDDSYCMNRYMLAAAFGRITGNLKVELFVPIRTKRERDRAKKRRKKTKKKQQQHIFTDFHNDIVKRQHRRQSPSEFVRLLHFVVFHHFQYTRRTHAPIRVRHAHSTCKRLVQHYNVGIDDELRTLGR